MKAFALFLVLSLTTQGLQAKPIQNPEEKMSLEMQRHKIGLITKVLRALELSAWMSYALLPKESGSPKVLNKIPNIGNLKPLAIFHPTEVKEEMKEVKENWKDFEFKGFGPSTPRPFSPFDFRIIG